MMSNLDQNLAGLSANEKRALLARLLDEQAKISEGIPLSYAQQRLWYLDRLEPNSPAYNIPTVLRLSGPLRVPALERAFQLILQRHEALRTRFLCADDTPVQVIDDPLAIDMPVVDFSNLKDTERENRLQKLIDEEIRRPFDLTRDLMIRLKLVRLAPEDHVLIINTHHIASDEWSLKILFHELGEIYGATVEERPLNLEEPPIQYADFAIWQREWLQGERLEGQLNFWREHLKPPLPKLELPGDFFRASAGPTEGAIRMRELPETLREKIKLFSRRFEVTPFMTLLAGYAALLRRYTAQDDIIIGSPIAGRTRMEVENVIGFFVNTLALRTLFRKEQTFQELLGAVRGNTLAAYANQDLPFDKLVQELHPNREPGATPFIQTVFTYQAEFLDPLRLPGLRARLLNVETGSAKFDLTLIVRDTPEGLHCVAEYSLARFQPETIDRLLRHYETLLGHALEQPKARIDALPILSEAERHEILVEWNPSDQPYPKDTSVAQLVAEQALKRGKQIAVRYEQKTLTYAELNKQANQLAHYLQSLGVQRGQLVGLALERSPEMIAAMLAILKTGAAYVPLDPTYPAERLDFMIADTGISIIVTSRDASPSFKTPSTRLVCLEEIQSELRKQSSRDPVVAFSSEDLTYVIYTSGSTGRPKGVAVPHRGITRLVCNTDYISLNPRERIAQASNANFDAATFEIWGALIHGGELVGIRKELALSPRDFARQLRDKQITTIFLTTALFNQLAAEVPGIFGSLRNVLFGGEAVDPKWVRSVLENGPPERLLHVYGPTENTTFSSWHLVTAASLPPISDRAKGTIPIGKPIAHSEMYILDEERQPVPVGVPGELYVGGDGLALGYLNRPELTSEKFVPHPFKAGASLYRTGDLGRYRADGNIEFVGRTDFQIKIRGFRVELGEIESLLGQHGSVKECVVVARDDGGDRRLVAYIVSRTEQPVSAVELRQFLKDKLPDYMLPGAFVFLKSLPWTPNEKIDRKALPPPEISRSTSEMAFVAPRDAVEQQLTKIWEKILGIQPISIEDRFFDLGGHSLLAVRLFTQIEKAFEKKLPLATLFKAQTIKELAAVIRDEHTHNAWSTLVDIQPEGARPPIYWAHSLGGDGGGGFFYYRKLAELLGENQPSYGIRSPQTPFNRIETMASHYIHELKAFQPHGPYYLGGFCFGGNLAYEMARQLTAAGDEVGLLILLESAPANISRKQLGPGSMSYVCDNLAANFRDFMDQSWHDKKVFLGKKAAALARRLWQRGQGATAAGAKAPPALANFIDMDKYPKDYVKYAETHWEALLNYWPGPLGAKIVLFRARKQPLSCLDPTLGWHALAQKLTVKVIPGSHDTMLQEPNVGILARELRMMLDELHH